MTLTDDQEDAVLGYLAEGYGVEDAAVEFGIPVASVRALVADLRAAGLISELFETKRPARVSGPDAGLSETPQDERNGE